MNSAHDVDNNRSCLVSAADLEALLKAWPYLPMRQPLADRAAVARSLAASIQSQLDDSGCGPVTLDLEQAPEGCWLSFQQKLVWDSAHFGFDVAQIDPIVCPSIYPTAETLDAGLRLINRCLTRCKSAGIDLVFASAFAADNTTQLCLSQLGFYLVDTVVAYRLRLTDRLAWNFDPNIRLAQPADMQALGSIAEQCFGDPGQNVNRFSADPVFDKDKVRAMYRAWAERSVHGYRADAVLVYCLDGEPVGFLSLEMPTVEDVALSLNMAHLQLGAVAPWARRRGIFSSLTKASARWLAAKDVEWLDMKTHLATIAIANIWTRLGAELVSSSHRFHKKLG